MSFEMKDNSASLFKNDKRTEDTHPQAKGSAKINGVEYWVSAWTRQTKDGVKWQSLSFTAKQPAIVEKPKATYKNVDDLQDDIPWND